MLSESSISYDQFDSVAMVREIRKSLEDHRAELGGLSRPSVGSQTLLAQLDRNYAAFVALEKEIHAREHPLNKLPDMPDDIRQKIIDNDLNQILDSLVYDYSNNIPNRAYNLVTGSMKMNGNLYAPDEEIDFTAELTKDGWGSVYKYGWVIYGPTERWAFGGGLCGSATITFTPSWRAGLDIVTRFPHSTYFSSLYPEDSYGLDATIYRGHKNLVMKNTTGSPLLYYAVDEPEKKQITMYLIGNSPYANIEIEGPIELGFNTVKWIRRMETFDGKIVEDELTTRYSNIH